MIVAAEYSNQSKLRFWCQMVLPLVYDDSLSYMELLNKVVAYLNNTIKDVGSCETNIELLLDAFKSLQDYVNEIVEDISPLIEEKIDEMIESGEFGEILADVLATIVAPEYDTTESYIPINYAIYEGSLYCCTSNTTGEWDSTKWRETTVGEELNTLMQRVYTLKASQVENDSSVTGATVKDALNTMGDKIDESPIINIANELDESLSDANFNTAFFSALTKSKRVYIPSGTYHIHIELNQDCDIYADSNTYLQPSATDVTIFSASDCSFSLHGGNLSNGQDDDTRVRLNYYLIRLNRCKECVIEKIVSPYSKTSGIIWLVNCINVTIQNSRFINFLRAATFIADTCKNITIRNNYYNGAKTQQNQDYCYFVYTGVESSGTTTEPAYNLLYENNYCENSEDCGLDTHGASNVTIRNNTILNTVNAITAYNDNSRALRPQGWSMNNVLIENNFCKSSKTVQSGSQYPHPYLFLGASLTAKKSEVPDNYGTFDDFKNCVVRNNYFETANNYPTGGAIYLSQSSKNVTFENNTFNLLPEATTVLLFRRSFNFAFNNNACIGKQMTINPTQGTGCIKDNTGIKIDFSVNAVCYFYGPTITQGYVPSPTLQTGDIYWSTDLRMCTSYGLRARYAYGTAVKTFDITVVDGIATTENNLYIPDLAISLTGDGTLNAYITDVLDYERFTIRNASGNPVPDGNYTATIRDITYSTL